MDLFESFSEDITKWEVLRDVVDLDLSEEFKEDSKYGPRVQLLPRKSVNIYGNIPKMEQRIFSKCKECRLIFNPRNILSHKTCLGRTHTSFSKIRKNSKKSHSNTPSPPPFKKPPSPSSPSVLSVAIDASKVISPKMSKVSSSSNSCSPNDTSGSSHKSSSRVSSGTSGSKANSSLILKSPKSEHSSHSSSKLSKLHSTESSTLSTSTSKSSSSSSHSSGNSSTRHKKSRKSSSSSSKSMEEFNPSIHCGVIEDNKGPCTRSLSCSVHRSQLRKLITSRSKEVHHLLNERKVSKEKETKHNSSKTHHNFPNDLETKDPGEHYVPATVKSNTLSIILPKSDSCINQNITTSNKQLLDLTDLDINFSKNADFLLNKESDAGVVPVVYMPMSPVSVVNPVEYVKIGKNIIRLESPQSATSPPITTNPSVLLGIPNNIKVKMYNTHPKPITLPSFGAKKIGGAILLSKQELSLQRNNLLMAISSNANMGNSIESYRTSLNNSNLLYKSNILKNKNTSKSYSCKRTLSEKIVSSDSKQLKYSANLNGFLIHSNISETADAPSSNLSYLNIK